MDRRDRRLVLLLRSTRELVHDPVRHLVVLSEAVDPRAAPAMSGEPTCAGRERVRQRIASERRCRLRSAMP
jgi:hypothetical protein